MAANAIGIVALILTALSLSHSANGIVIVTHCDAWESWAMAAGSGSDAAPVGPVTCGQIGASTGHKGEGCSSEASIAEGAFLELPRYSSLARRVLTHAALAWLAFTETQNDKSVAASASNERAAPIRAKF